MDSKILIYAGEIVPCFLRTGEAITVKLRLIKISEIPTFLDISLDEAKSIAFCIESPAFPAADPKDVVNPAALAFVDTLTDESFLDLVAKNTDLNFTRALAMSDQRLKRAEACGLGLAQLAGSLASLLNRYSPKSDSPAASPASSSAG